MTILSNLDIENEIGENIAIFPFSKENLRSASYNLTVSKLAWNLATKKSIYDPNTEKITIAKDSTALIQTNEAIWVSKRVAGTYHSKVGLVSKGLSHIGTTLDPEYIGVSLITVHNYGNDDIILIPEDDTFVTLIFYYVNTEAIVQTGSNSPGQIEMLQGFDITPEEIKWLTRDFRKVPSQLKLKLKECPDFQDIFKKREEEKLKLESEVLKRLKDEQNKKQCLIIYGITLLTFSIVIVGLFYLSSHKDKIGNEPWYDLTVNIAYSIILVIPASVLIKILSDLKIIKIFSDLN